eukprot:4744647-Pleurochrysis_carterae.AAC.1
MVVSVVLVVCAPFSLSTIKARIDGFMQVFFQNCRWTSDGRSRSFAGITAYTYKAPAKQFAVGCTVADSQNFRHSASATYSPIRYWESGDRMATLIQHGPPIR